KSFTWHGFDDNRSIDVGGDRVHFGTAGAAVSVWDHETRKHRPSDLRDVYDVARLVDTLEHVHFHIRTLVARDMVEARDLDLNTAYAAAMGTSKPMGTSFFQPEHVVEAVDMFDQMLGGKPGSFAERPFCVANNTFVVPPLRYAEDAVRSMVAQVHTGMPINLLSAGQAGATSPAALAGSLAQALAECLSALTCVNLLKPGHPCVMGLWPFV
ncbi:MAG TPA: methyltransferase, partial [Acidimicrobiia bacterium]|nr:methyltransferase [Acidimicrobiia bacterium]